MTRALLLLLAVVGALLLSAPAGAFSRQDVTITSADGTAITATLTLPAGTAPASGWPAVIYMHGLGGNRGDMLTLAQTMGIAGERYAVLAYDARGHGGSGGLIGIDGPKEVADVKAVFGWLRNRPDVADNRIGGWGVSYGGGAAWNSLVADVPWAALAISISWTDLRQALVPQGLAKTGVMAGFLGSLDPKRVDPEVFALRDAAFAGNLATVGPFAAARSSLPKLKGVKTPVFMMQGRRDFAFGLERARPPTARSPGRSSSGSVSTATRRRRASRPTRRRCSPRARSGSTATSAATPPRRSRSLSPSPPRTGVGSRPGSPGCRKSSYGDPAPSGSAVERYRPGWALPVPAPATHEPTEVFGSPTVQVTATARGGWSRIVAVLSARTPAGKEIVVAGGGVPTRAGPDLPHLARRPGDVPPQGLAAHADPRIVVARAESREPPLPRSSVPVDGSTRGDGRHRGLPALATPVSR